MLLEPFSSSAQSAMGSESGVDGEQTESPVQSADKPLKVRLDGAYWSCLAALTLSIRDSDRPYPSASTRSRARQKEMKAGPLGFWTAHSEDSHQSSLDHRWLPCRPKYRVYLCTQKGTGPGEFEKKGHCNGFRSRRGKDDFLSQGLVAKQLHTGMERINADRHRHEELIAWTATRLSSNPCLLGVTSLTRP